MEFLNDLTKIITLIETLIDLINYLIPKIDQLLASEKEIERDNDSRVTDNK